MIRKSILSILFVTSLIFTGRHEASAAPEPQNELSPRNVQNCVARALEGTWSCQAKLRELFRVATSWYRLLIIQTLMIRAEAGDILAQRLLVDLILIAARDGDPLAIDAVVGGILKAAEEGSPEALEFFKNATISSIHGGDQEGGRVGELVLLVLSFKDVPGASEAHGEVREEMIETFGPDSVVGDQVAALLEKAIEGHPVAIAVFIGGVRDAAGRGDVVALMILFHWIADQAKLGNLHAVGLIQEFGVTMASSGNFHVARWCQGVLMTAVAKGVTQALPAVIRVHQAILQHSPR